MQSFYIVITSMYTAGSEESTDKSYLSESESQIRCETWTCKLDGVHAF